MRKPTLIIAGILTFLIVLFQPSVSTALFALLFLGMIPGTTTSIPSWAMLLISISGIYLAIRWISNQPLFIGNHQQQERTARQLARKKVLAMTANTPVRPLKTAPGRRAAKPAKA